jgi:YgiT-type zinc finger domain-containing protein
MKCIICHGQEIETAEVQEALRVGPDVAYVRVATPVCGTCGERYYSRQTIRFLEQVERDLASGRLKVHAVGRVLECDAVPPAPPN